MEATLAGRNSTRSDGRRAGGVLPQVSRSTNPLIMVPDSGDFGESVGAMIDTDGCKNEGRMEIIETGLPGVLILEPKIVGDPRGFFLEVFQAQRCAEFGIAGPFVQDNLSRSRHGVLRGLHLQNPKAQGKLVSVMRGCVRDVAVDVRRGSPTFGLHVNVELSDDNRRQLWVPRGFAHGFVVLSASADFFYKCDEVYSPADQIVIRWDDPALAIDWGIASPELSSRDATAPHLAEATRLPVYSEV
jgi:dTDP-4-dehydrorhamnose 3,5-epimerase